MARAGKVCVYRCNLRALVSRQPVYLLRCPVTFFSVSSKTVNTHLHCQSVHFIDILLRWQRALPRRFISIRAFASIRSRFWRPRIRRVTLVDIVYPFIHIFPPASARTRRTATRGHLKSHADTTGAPDSTQIPEEFVKRGAPLTAHLPRRALIATEDAKRQQRSRVSATGLTGSPSLDARGPAREFTVLGPRGYSSVWNYLSLFIRCRG